MSWIIDSTVSSLNSKWAKDSLLPRLMERIFLSRYFFFPPEIMFVSDDPYLGITELKYLVTKKKCGLVLIGMVGGGERRCIGRNGWLGVLWGLQLNHLVYLCSPDLTLLTSAVS